VGLNRARRSCYSPFTGLGIRADGGVSPGAALNTEVWTFGAFILDPRERVLRRAGEAVALKPKDVEVLLALVERHGELVEKSALLDQVWRGVTVEECNLSQHVATLRRALGDDARVPAFIETVPRRGYRFVAPVGVAERPARTPTPSAGTPAATPPPEAQAAPLATPAPAPTFTPPPAPAPLPVPPPPVGPKGIPTTWRLRLGLAVIGGAVALLAGAHFRPAGNVPALHSIAVLPVQDLTGERRHARLAEALTEALVADLRDVGEVTIRSAKALGPEVSVGQASPYHASEVDAVVECSIVGEGERLKVVAELIDARNDRLIWADVFESDRIAYTELEERMSQALLTRIVRLAVGGERSPPPGGLAAARREYELARFYMSRRTPQVVKESLEHFEAAVELAPEFAQAHAGLAEALLLAAEHRVVAPGPALEGAEREARRALEQDPQLAEACATLAGVAAARWDFDEAEAGYRRALELDPALGLAHLRYAALLTVLDRHREALREAQAAHDLDPSNPVAGVALAAAYSEAGQHGSAVAQARSTLRAAPRLASAYAVLGRAYQAAGKGDDAVAAFAEAVRLSDRNPVHLAALARLQAQRGSSEPARQMLAELQRPPSGRSASPLDVAAVLAALGEVDAAFATLERAVEAGTPWLAPADPGVALATLHDDPRFARLVARMRARRAPVTAR